MHPIVVSSGISARPALRWRLERMIIVTTNDLPGFRILAVHGEVMGLTVRSRDAATNWVAGWRSIGGGEIPEFTQMLIESRMQVMGRMVEEAQRRGGNAIVAMRFDANEIAQAWTEICAYGTAVTVEPIADGPGSTAQSQQLAARPVPTLQPQPPAQGYAPPQMVPSVQGQVPWPPPGAPGAPAQQ